MASNKLVLPVPFGPAITIAEAPRSIRCRSLKPRNASTSRFKRTGLDTRQVLRFSEGGNGSPNQVSRLSTRNQFSLEKSERLSRQLRGRGLRKWQEWPQRCFNVRHGCLHACNNNPAKLAKIVVDIENVPRSWSVIRQTFRNQNHEICIPFLGTKLLGAQASAKDLRHRRFDEWR